ncbi:hypothetical protein UUU_22810 [Klebsiella pneumoniae subsp. pneumoniae DSM 30104 = JCM 1662 = NBRC 14940]|nr:hypothetical protein UUU_22810 [Klebsiella pneumoniae subsp. pneumoniae DSM 30104 = JCM 1662 = NBRC 14940]
MAAYYALRIVSFVPKQTLRPRPINNEKEGGYFLSRPPYTT